MRGFHDSYSILGSEDIVSAAGGGDSLHLRHAVAWEIVVPRCVANVFLGHHPVPFPACHLRVVIVAEERVALETLPYLLCPAVGVGVAGGGEEMVHGLCLVHTA